MVSITGGSVVPAPDTQVVVTTAADTTEQSSSPSALKTGRYRVCLSAFELGFILWCPSLEGLWFEPQTLRLLSPQWQIQQSSPPRPLRSKQVGIESPPICFVKLGFIPWCSSWEGLWFEPQTLRLLSPQRQIQKVGIESLPICLPWIYSIQSCMHVLPCYKWIWSYLPL